MYLNTASLSGDSTQQSLATFIMKEIAKNLCSIYDKIYVVTKYVIIIDKKWHAHFNFIRDIDNYWSTGAWFFKDMYEHIFLQKKVVHSFFSGKQIWSMKSCFSFVVG